MAAGNGGLPETSRSEILQALEEFDDEHRGEGRWADWQSNRNHKYAIEREGRLYPVKKIISMATGRPTNSFSGSFGLKPERSKINVGYITELCKSL